MSYFTDMSAVRPEEGAGHRSYDLLSGENGCVNGCCGGVSDYYCTEYQQPGCHEDQECFIVLSGRGFARVGEEEREVLPGMMFVAPRLVPHAMKSSSETEPLRVCWFHAAV